MKKRLLLSMIVTGVIAFGLLGCKKAEVKDEAEDIPVKVDTISAERGTLLISETFMGSVSAQRELKVYPRTAGEVTMINVKPGDHVNAGDILFQLNDEFAQLDLESAKSNLSRTQAEVKKSQGSEEVLTQQKEWQALENQNSRIVDSNYNLTTAKEDYNRQVSYLGEARDRENGAYDDYKKADKKYDKAKDILNDYEDLQKSEPDFANKTLRQASEMTTDQGPTQEHIDKAKRLWSKASNSDNGKLSEADVTAAGVSALYTAKESLYDKYDSAKSAREAQEDKVTSAQRTTDKAAKTLQDDYTAYRQDVDNMMVRDIALLEDNKRIQQIDINSSSINVEKAKQSLEQYTVTAPISGVIGKVGIKEFEMVATGTEAILIENTDNMRVEFSVTEEVRNNLREGQSVSVENNNDKITGHIIEIAGVPEEQSGLFPIKAEIPGSAGVLSGTRVSVTLDSYKDDRGFVIPYDSLYHANGQSFVYVVKNGVVARKNVKTGMFDSDNIVVTEGIDAGDRIITSWNSELKEGLKVQENLVETPHIAVETEPAQESAVNDQVSESTSETEDAVSDEKTEEDTKRTVRATTTVFIRSTPDKDTNDNKLGKANEGDEYTAIGAENGWTKVLYNDSEAYIKSDYLTEVTGSGEAE